MRPLHSAVFVPAGFPVRAHLSFSLTDIHTVKSIIQAEPAGELSSANGVLERFRECERCCR